MNENKKSRPSVAALERENGAEPFAGDTTSKRDSTMKGMRISSILLPGSENGQTQAELSALVGVDTRTVRLMIERERRAGALIMSNNRDGYYLARSREDVDRWHQRTEGRAHEMMVTADAVKEAASRYVVKIEDSPDVRQITIGKRSYRFKKYVHTFLVDDDKALEERENGARKISAWQSIVCYVPEAKYLPEYSLYSGLPTKHKIKIPMVIDAPYALTTSREHIEDSNIRWNGIVRKEMYSAIFDVMEALKEKERSGILRFVRISRQLHGSNVVYANDMFDFAYLKEYPFLSVLKSRSILPTYDPEIFVSAQSGRAMYFPEAVNELFLEGAFGDIRPGSALDINKKDYENLLTALDCQPAQVDRAMNVLEKHGPEFILENNFRAKLYEYLQTVPPEFKARIKEMAIIPVYGRKSSAVQFISWKDDSIFVKKGSTESAEDYYVLNEKYLSKAACEKIFGENINEMNAEWERGRYNETLRKTLRGSKVTELYHYLLSEFAKGAFDKKSSWDVLRGAREFIPLKNQLGQITDQELFISRLAIGHFQTELVCGLSVHPECAKFAERLQCRELRTIHFEDINYQNDLTADDIEELYYSNYFVNRDEIIRHFYNEALVSDELMEEYDLVHLIIGRSGDDELNDSIPFPEARVGDSRALNMHIQRLWRNPVYVIKVKVERTVDKGEDAHGNIMTLDSDGVRKQTMVNYTPENLRSKCFCQMCKRLKPYTLIEVNNIQKNPQFYFPQLRISLCLECSKRFEALRNNQGLREAFMKTIRQTSCFGVGKVDVPIGEETVTFTAKHLAEIQEILRQMPADQKGKS